MVKSIVSKIRQGKYKAQLYHSLAVQSWLHLPCQVLWVKDKFPVSSFPYLCQSIVSLIPNLELGSFVSLVFPISTHHILKLFISMVSQIHFYFLYLLWPLYILEGKSESEGEGWRKTVSIPDFFLEIPITCYCSMTPFVSWSIFFYQFLTNLFLSSYL